MIKHDSDIIDNIYKFAGTVYLTAIALFQGIALALLTNYFIAFLFLDLSDRSSSDYTGVCGHYIFTVMAVFTIWHHYIYRILYLKWFPNIWDTVIPFSLGVSEISMILLLGKINEPEKVPINIIINYWYCSAGMLCICGIFAYLHGTKKADPKLYPAIFLYDIRAFLKSLKLAYMVASVFCAITGILFFLIASKVAPYWCFYKILVIFSIQIIWYEFYHCRKIKPVFLKLEQETALFRKREG
ncbi:MAG: hypothetical protein ABRQ35_06570 [Smithellaceae bacterium]